MVDKTQPDPAQSQLEGYQVDAPDVGPPLTSPPAEDKAGSTSASPPTVPTTTKPSPLTDQSMTNNNTRLSPSLTPEARPTETVMTQNEPRDPQVAALKAIFPDYDEAILQSVLESVNGSQDRAIDLLLGMSDPNFKSDTPPVVQQPQMTQEDLDEQLARRLMLEEQQQAQQWQQRQRPHRRSSRMQGQQQQQPQQPGPTPVGDKDTMTEIQEQFSKYAEIGRKNFGALVSKVKSKIQEFDKPDAGGSGSGVQPTWSGSGGTSYHDPNATSQMPPPRTNYQAYQGHHAATGIPAPLTNTVISQPAAFYDPNPSSQPTSPQTQPTSPSFPERKTMQPSVSNEGYAVEPIPSSTGDALASISASTTSQPAQPATTNATSGGNFSASVPPRGPSPANPIDGGKLGLLPKRPISLIRDPPQTQQQAHRHDSDEDALEYAENPFDDDRK
ncbi:hypothetical protein D9756_007631 [Leucocoprinus leucothites]|uniref:CUE domain-containing protein n=1 Tax=Leucocoprinus leucothites TaxID=201217 RepID=A0A8H5FWX7_9AGAR|nr:hypothetical protein D9756_007631 [Leucoagaricus leucothites]